MTTTISSFQTTGVFLTTEPLVVTSSGTISPAGVAAGVYAPGAGTIDNAGVILGGGPQAAIYIHGAASITNTGSIGGDSFGIYAADIGGQGMVTNSGSIAATGVQGIGVGIGRGGTLVNNGSINGAGIYGAVLFDGGTVINGATARITGEKSGVGFRLGAGTVTNFGTIVAQPAGASSSPLLPGAVALGRGGSVTNGDVGNSTAFISGWQNGVYIKNQNGDVTNFGTILGADAGVKFSGAGGTVFNSGTITGGLAAVDFGTSGSQTLVIGTGSVLNGAIAHFQNGDLIDFSGMSETIAGFSAGVLSLVGTQSLDITFSGSFSLGLFSVASDGAGGTALTVACFAAGTRILGAGGEVAVEDLRPGDMVATMLGGRLTAVVWTGHRRVECARHRRPASVWPVRVSAGAFGAGAPRRELWLSPDHAVWVEGVLIPVRLLVNGATVDQVPVDAVTYWHVELAGHDVLLAEGLACESYLDTGNRGAFIEAAAVDAVAEFGPREAFAIWARRACAPLALGGDVVARVQGCLASRALALGWRRGGPGLRLAVAGREVGGGWEGDTVVFALPPGVAVARLVSAVFVPGWEGGEDWRRLGVAVSGIAVDGREVALAGVGWHASEPGWCWTDGDAVVAVDGGCRVVVRVAAVGKYWEAVDSGKQAHLGSAWN